MWTIYALVGPRTNQIRYVGQTKNHPEVRLEGHRTKDDCNRPKIAWIDELRRLGLKPLVVVLEYVPTLEEAFVVENLWIQRGKESGWQLLNWGNTKPVRRRLKLVKVDKVKAPTLNKHSTRPPGAPATVEGWYEWTLDNYLPAHPELLQTDKRGRGVGVQALAETMAALNGKSVSAMGGTASEVAKRLRVEAALPGGDRLGVDITHGGA